MENKKYGLPENVTASAISGVYTELSLIVKNAEAPFTLVIDFSGVKNFDSAGAVIVKKIETEAASKNLNVEKINIAPAIQKTYELFGKIVPDTAEEVEKKPFIERTGERGFHFLGIVKNYFILLSDISYWTFKASFMPKLRRKGEVIKQSILIGSDALPIIGLISFLIGFILALQSAAQLRQFGANIYVADLLAIAMVSEMGPLITAIMVSGRSGSAIAAEIATMNVTEEIDALKAMGIDPMPYLFVPKVSAMLITLPMLTTLANLIGILGGALIGLTYLDIELLPFFNEVFSVLRYKEIGIYLLKSFVFAFLIVISAIYFGMNVKGGSEGVGRSATASVVTTIFLVILADSIIGLLFYFE